MHLHIHTHIHRYTHTYTHTRVLSTNTKRKLIKEEFYLCDSMVITNHTMVVLTYTMVVLTYTIVVLTYTMVVLTYIMLVLTYTMVVLVSFHSEILTYTFSFQQESRLFLFLHVTWRMSHDVDIWFWYHMDVMTFARVLIRRVITNLKHSHTIQNNFTIDTLCYCSEILIICGIKK